VIGKAFARIWPPSRIGLIHGFPSPPAVPPAPTR